MEVSKPIEAELHLTPPDFDNVAVMMMVSEIAHDLEATVTDAFPQVLTFNMRTGQVTGRRRYNESCTLHIQRRNSRTFYTRSFITYPTTIPTSMPTKITMTTSTSTIHTTCTGTVATTEWVVSRM